MPLVTPAEASAPEAAPVAVQLRRVSKSFPGVLALRDVSFDLLAGEVHGLVGANGAGKSTMIRMLSGASTPDSGEIEVGGTPLLNDNPRHLRAIGISAIYQELTIIPEMTALSNAFLGAAPSRWGVTDFRRMRARYAELSAWMGVAIDPGVKAGALPIANQQMLEIMRAVLADGRVLIMDEPTAPLGPFERERPAGSPSSSSRMISTRRCGFATGFRLCATAGLSQPSPPPHGAKTALCGQCSAT
jgi:ABC-type sugar transport system ATPase subunit